MKYIIASEKVGVVGEEFVPGEGINIEALLAHGFIVSDKIVNDTTAPKSAKTKALPKKD
jgi:hypothetical protein